LSNTPASHHPRATRFPIRAPVRYRTRASGWAYGVSVNASATGILFGCQRLEDVPERVEVEMALPDGLARVLATVVITRAEAAVDGSAEWLMAAKIVRYALSRTT
jgi:hypothetical protein